MGEFTVGTPQGGELFTKGPKTMREKINMMWRAMQQNNLLPGINTTIQASPNGKAVNALFNPSDATVGPFGVSMRSNPNDPTGNTFQAMVNLQSDFLKSCKPTDFLAVSGLNVWFPLIANDMITIFCPVTMYVPQSATVQSYGMGSTTFSPSADPWSGSDNGIVYDDGATPPVQAGLNIMLAYTTPDRNGKPYLIQAQRDHILMEDGIIAGRPAVYDFSHRRRYGITAP